MYALLICLLSVPSWDRKCCLFGFGKLEIESGIATAGEQETTLNKIC